MYQEPTSFQEIYDRFLGKITDDMYYSGESEGVGLWTKEDTMADLKNILIDAIPGFEFPRFEMSYDLDAEEFNCSLTSEEINIFALLMQCAWVERQVASIENTRMKYSGQDFKMTSQANHLAKLMELKKESERKAHHMQRLYRRRKDDNGNIKSNWSILKQSVFDG